jgi:hypothetical protein
MSSAILQESRGWGTGRGTMQKWPTLKSEESRFETLKLLKRFSKGELRSKNTRRLRK